MKNNSPYITSIKEIMRYNRDHFLNKKKTPPTDKKTHSPLSGSEPKFEPNRWNNIENIKNNHNCYAYVLNTIVHKRNGKPQPGYFSNFPPLKSSDYICQTFYQRLKKDIPSLYLITFDRGCKRGFYKGFLALDPKVEDQDYHFYRQDDNGYWSHKPGRQDAINYDADNKFIKNPLKANRNYKYFNYSNPCFFFCMNNKLARSRSRSKTRNYNY